MKSSENSDARDDELESTEHSLKERVSRVSGLVQQLGPKVFGHRIRRLRDLQGLSIRSVADKAGISKNSIVRMEQGRGTQAVTVLKVCNVLGIHVERLIDSSNNELKVAMVHRNEDDRWFDSSDIASASLLGITDRAITSEERKQAVRQGSISPVNLLQCRLQGGNILPCVLELHQKSSERSHVGEEFVYVLQGSAIISIAGQDHRLEEGESIAFWSAEPHSYAPADPQKTPVKILSVRVGN